MEFKRCFIGGVAYGCGDTAISRALRGQGNVAQPRRAAPLPAFAGCKSGTQQFVNFEEAATAPSLMEAIVRNDGQGARAREIFLAMAVCHAVVLEEVGGDTYWTLTPRLSCRVPCALTSLTSHLERVVPTRASWRVGVVHHIGRWVGSKSSRALLQTSSRS